MSTYIVEGDTLTAIGDAIRERGAATEAILPSEMPAAIKRLPALLVGGSLPVRITNDNYTSDTELDYMYLPDETNNLVCALVYAYVPYYLASGKLSSSAEWYLIDTDSNGEYRVNTLIENTAIGCGVTDINNSPNNTIGTKYRVEKIEDGKYLINKNYAGGGYPSSDEAQLKFALYSEYIVEV